MIDWLIDRMIDWLINRLSDWLIDCIDMYSYRDIFLPWPPFLCVNDDDDDDDDDLFTFSKQQNLINDWGINKIMNG